MPTCQNCGKKWTWKQTVKTLFRLKKCCPYCGKKQYESASSRRRTSAFLLIPLVLLPINAWFEFSVGMVLLLAIPLYIILLGLYPFILKLSNEMEPYW
ncbi:TIGR04104 family putative zinc finger protein [Virgibacillus halodenitrificans]|uniref:TIGR04104 family putative zinc finger protein n=1 Tax=Virgibacillus halodenitrificans TaxID=1482 RepID=UPI00045C6BD4|nr:TIGR04104 family putative zinc finger protein [Virgibacillus halodenitrificans]MEC2158493.1 hypothetical protein [Virgibacillus halodenitrificans]CDQ37117.1 cxxc_20_cxxc protein [Virgibacillus halodenitrificans]